MEPAGQREGAARLRGEEDLLRRIQAQLHQPEGHVVTGIGDDCAVLAIPGATRRLIVSTDLLIEHVHFEWAYQTPQQLGAKALAVNLSDLAAMGAEPWGALVSLALPAGFDASDVERIYAGMEELAREVKTSIVGGDSSASRGAFMLSITVLGLAPPDEIARRSGASPGDRLFVTGSLGDAAAGLEILQKRSGESSPPLRTDLAAAADELCRRFRLPKARLAEGRFLAREQFATAMMDLSDGLSTDLHRLCDASQVGARLEAPALPQSAALTKAGSILKQGAEGYRLHGGEDYELLFSVPDSKAKDLLARWPFPQTRLTEIGRIVERSDGIRLISATQTAERLMAKGFDHFAEP